MRLVQLTERGCVKVQPLDADADLVGADLAARVEPLRSLREHAARTHHAVQTERRGPGRGTRGHLARICGPRLLGSGDVRPLPSDARIGATLHILHTPRRT